MRRTTSNNATAVGTLIRIKHAVIAVRCVEVRSPYAFGAIIDANIAVAVTIFDTTGWKARRNSEGRTKIKRVQDQTKK